MIDFIYIGQWNNLNKHANTLFGLNMKFSKGKSLINIVSMTGSNQNLFLNLRIYEDKYIDQNIIEILKIRLDYKDKNSLQWTGYKHQVNFRYYNYKKLVEENKQLINYNLTLLNKYNSSSPVFISDNILLHLDI